LALRETVEDSRYFAISAVPSQLALSRCDVEVLNKVTTVVLSKSLKSQQIEKASCIVKTTNQKLTQWLEVLKEKLTAGMTCVDIQLPL